MKAHRASAARAAALAAEATQAVMTRLAVGSTRTWKAFLTPRSRKPGRALRSILVADMCELLLQRLLVCNELVNGVDGVLQLHAEVQVLGARERLGTAQTGGM